MSIVRWVGWAGNGDQSKLNISISFFSYTVADLVCHEQTKKTSDIDYHLFLHKHLQQKYIPAACMFNFYSKRLACGYFYQGAINWSIPNVNEQVGNSSHHAILSIHI